MTVTHATVYVPAALEPERESARSSQDESEDDYVLMGLMETSGKVS